ncbi:MAG: rhamnan synthesis F family protein [Chitinispirillales bacterium]|nr:rhamnan synthesis F family protein [Chitinispirillales bacterium]
MFAQILFSFNMKKILVHLHLFYEEQFDIFAEKIKSALERYNYSLFITVSDCNDEIKQKFLSFKPDAKFIIVKNIGADIFPFITVLNSVNLEDYDYIIKGSILVKQKLFCCNTRRDNGKQIYNSFKNFRA